MRKRAFRGSPLQPTVLTLPRPAACLLLPRLAACDPPPRPSPSVRSRPRAIADGRPHSAALIPPRPFLFRGRLRTFSTRNSPADGRPHSAAAVPPPRPAGSPPAAGRPCLAAASRVRFHRADGRSHSAAAGRTLSSPTGDRVRSLRRSRSRANPSPGLPSLFGHRRGRPCFADRPQPAWSRPAVHNPYPRWADVSDRYLNPLFQGFAISFGRDPSASSHTIQHQFQQ